MKKTLLLGLVLLGWNSYASPNEEFPSASISNNIVDATLLLPNQEKGYYQATRFDWSGVIESLEYDGHSYFGQWFKNYNPKTHDAIKGPVEEFEPIGYDDAKVGDEFIKIGVGALSKTSDKPYSSFVLYDIKNPGIWKVKTKKDEVQFTQELKDESGYGYIYTKIVHLQKGKPELVLEHSVKNTGTKNIETNVYDHNFFMIDGEPTGPNIRIKFPFDISGTGRGIGTLADLKSREINFLRVLNDREDMYIGSLNGYANDATDYDIRIENTKSKAGVRIRGDQPLSKLVFWANPNTACPEPYIHIEAKPGQEFKWNIHYEFYTF
ncbi:MAG TPA: hypothetical protein VLJ41_04155 [Segetibacter sp.]|nr:hypothetical protein [Segetibacter sp.]